MTAFFVGANPKGLRDTIETRRLAAPSPRPVYSTGLRPGHMQNSSHRALPMVAQATREKARSPVPPVRHSRLSNAPPNSPQPQSGKRSCGPSETFSASLLNPPPNSPQSQSGKRSLGPSESFSASLHNTSDIVSRMIARTAASAAVASAVANHQDVAHQASQDLPLDTSVANTLSLQHMLAQAQAQANVHVCTSDNQTTPSAPAPSLIGKDEGLSPRCQSAELNLGQDNEIFGVGALITNEIEKQKVQRFQEQLGAVQNFGFVLATSEVSTAPPPSSAPGSLCGAASSCGAESSVTAAMRPIAELDRDSETTSLGQVGPRLCDADHSEEKATRSFPPTPASTTRESNVAEVAVQLAQGLQLLNDALEDIHKEKTQRETLANSVRNLNRRLDDGLMKVGEVTKAHSDSENATDAVLGAMRRCIDELSVHCVWPPLGAPNDLSQGKTLSAAVHHQQKQIQELQQLQKQLEAQHEEQRQQVSSLSVIMQMQQQRMDEGVAVVTAAAAAFPSRLEAMAASISAVQNRVAELAAAAAEKVDTDATIARQLSALQNKVLAQEQAMLAEKQQVAELLRVVQLRETHQGTEVENNSVSEIAAGLQQLKDEVTTIATAVNILCGRVSDLSEEEPSRAIQTEIGVIASVVSKLSERVDRLGGAEAASLSMFTPADSEDTVQMRHRLAALVDDVQRGHAELQGVEAAPTASALTAARQDSQLGAVINYLEKRADESRAQRKHAYEPRVSPALPLASMPQIVITKAPSPRRWLDEPLSVSVGRRGARSTY